MDKVVIVSGNPDEFVGHLVEQDYKDLLLYFTSILRGIFAPSNRVRTSLSVLLKVMASLFLDA